MAVRIGSQAEDRLSGTKAADTIYGYDPNARTPPTVAATMIVSGLDNPLYLTAAPGDSRHLFILEKRGLVKVHDTGTGQTLGGPFLDVSTQVATAGEQGLLGLAFAPDFATSRRFYVYLSTTAGDVEIREYRTQASNPLVADAGSMRLIDRIDYPSSTNHRGGWIGFGPDGYLYVATGDGANGANAQSIGNQLGKILRLDVKADAFPSDPARNYALPPDNPASIEGIAGSAAGTGIYAAGLRNPWRVSFDRLTGEMMIGDVGQSTTEEIDLGRAGANYGWSATEGPFDPRAFPNFTNPIHAYGRDLGVAVTGGYVYRGPEPDFQGIYFFSDFGTSGIWTLQRASGSWSFKDLTGQVAVGGGPIGSVSSLGEDGAGNLYLVDYGGKIFRLDLRSGTGPDIRADAADVLSGGGGNDRIFGGGGNDSLYGGAGNDTLRGGPGADLLSGGSGVDYADYRDSSGPVRIDLARKTQAGGDAAGDRLVGIQGALGSAFNDALRGSGSHDTLRGGAGDDSISGNAGNDRLYGDAGQDTLVGGPGKDWMSGGPGADVFRWRSAGSAGPDLNSADVVRDFSHGAHDRLDLVAIDANSLRGGNQAFAFIGRADFTAAGQVRYEVSGSETRVLLNTDADHDAEGIIRLMAIRSLKAGDFLL
ncbi:PQQ-dependent sugar dehydrogenase [Microvirga sp. HBU67558]|uniref:PQQ-dependent sugar dehydrogenase n=1 Tax=Microvirga TaxID=186650 RepID=UPI001B3923E8|nr:MULTISPECIES: PQQ-dependent sugar dehydrogenase [unclassified Microvirga]MBQ0824011.1 PQQ-dependent sugar dehydrogenase [Microvirga sp. HBU67558]